MAGRRILVTGATGFLGGALATSLAAHGDRVTGQGRDRAAGAGLAGKGIRFVAAALDGPGPLPAALFDGGVETIVHCAGLSAPWGPRRAFAAANIEGTRRLLDAAVMHGASHFVLISSSSVYFRFRDQLGVREDIPLPAPVNAYAWSKTAAEQMLMRTKDIKTSILRPRGLYGKGDTALLPRLLAACERGPLPLLRGGRAVIDLTHIDDAVAAIHAVLATEGAGPALFNVSGGEAVPVRQIVERAAARLHRKVAWKPVPWPLLRAAVHVTEAKHYLMRQTSEPRITAYAAGLFAFSQSLDIGVIAASAGWRPGVDFETGLDRTFG